MVKVKKKGGNLEEFMENKIVAGVKKAGVTAKEAVDVAREVSGKAVKKTVVTTEEIAKMVVDSLKKENKKVADAFVKFRKGK